MNVERTHRGYENFDHEYFYYLARSSVHGFTNFDFQIVMTNKEWSEKIWHILWIVSSKF